MSTEQSVDQESLEATRQQLRGLVHEIESLSRSDVELAQFYEGFLNRIVTAMAAIGGAIWSVNANGQLSLAYQINLRETRLAENEEHQQQHGRLLHRVLTNRQPMLVAPQSSDEESGAANPTHCQLILSPMQSDKEEVDAVLEIFQRPGATPATERGYLRFVLEMCEKATDYLKTRRLKHFNERQTLWARLETFTRRAHESLVPRHTAYTIANEGRRLIECDRVTVAIRKGETCRVEAISGQEMFDKRSNTVTLLGKLATAVCATGEEVWYTGDTANMAPQVEETLQAYIDDSHSKTVAVLPLRRPKEDETDEQAEEYPVIGAIIVEQIEDSRLAEGLLQRVAVVSEHSSTALANALEHDSLFLMPLWRTLGNATWIVKGRTLPKTIAIGSTVLVLLLWLCFWPADFQLQGKGTLEPVSKQEVFAGVDGIVTEVNVKHGDHVHKGDLLLKMRNSDLGIKMQETQGNLSATTEQVNAILVSLNKARELKLSQEEQVRLSGQRMQLEKTRESLEEQLKLYRDKISLLEVRSPIEGEIVTWQIEEKLLHRPVEKGQLLVSVADRDKQWELQIDMPEDRMGYIAEARKQLTPEQLGTDQDLRVTYILATDPGKKHIGTIKEIHAAAEVHGDDGNVVVIRVAVDKEELPDLRPGSGVTAKFYCGRRSVGFVWFHDVISFIQSKILFRL